MDIHTYGGKMSEVIQELFSEMVTTGNRTYFFDVKESKAGTRYLVISESKPVGTEFEHHRVMIFEENIEAFMAGFNKTIAYLGINQKQKPYTIEKIRQQHPKAYTKWSPKEDEALRKKYLEGMSVAELSHDFKRKPGAIQSRLEKLGIKKPA